MLHVQNRDVYVCARMPVKSCGSLFYVNNDFRHMKVVFDNNSEWRISSTYEYLEITAFLYTGLLSYQVFPRPLSTHFLADVILPIFVIKKRKISLTSLFIMHLISLKEKAKRCQNFTRNYFSVWAIWIYFTFQNAKNKKKGGFLPKDGFGVDVVVSIKR